MALKLDKTKDMDDGIWVEYQEGVEFKVRYLLPEKIRQLRKNHVKMKMKRGQLQEVVNDDAYNEDLVDYMVVDWKGVELKGKPVECNKENKLLLSNVNGNVFLFILDYAEEAQNFFADKEATALKNSKSSSTSS